MASRVVMPKLTDTMEEGVLLKWYKKEGDKVESGDPIAEVETDKAVMDLEAFASGTLKKILVPEGNVVPSGDLIALIAREDEDIKDVLSHETMPRMRKRDPQGGAQPAEGTQEKQKTPLPQGEVSPQEEATPEGTPSRGDGKRPPAASGPKEGPAKAEARPAGAGEEIKISPLARKMAEERGIDLSRIKGSGPGGRITQKDIESAPQPEAAPQPAEPSRAKGEAAAAAPAGQTVELSMMRKAIAKRM